jgi:hypothetical protein
MAPIPNASRIAPLAPTHPRDSTSPSSQPTGAAMASLIGLPPVSTAGKNPSNAEAKTWAMREMRPKAISSGRRMATLRMLK